MPLEEALKSEVILMAIPFSAVEQFGTSLPDWTGKTVVDTTNPYYTPNSAEILQGRLSAHYAAEKLPGADIVKAFNHLPGVDACVFLLENSMANSLDLCMDGGHR